MDLSIISTCPANWGLHALRPRASADLSLHLLSGPWEGVTPEVRIATKWNRTYSAELIFAATGTAGRAPSF